ncbi:MAG TPA: hypothetical protein VMI06_00165, partial [Terriglobia bacterium]|nr:hypothetical protein [Terriglobia bacterium]
GPLRTSTTSCRGLGRRLAHPIASPPDEGPAAGARQLIKAVGPKRRLPFVYFGVQSNRSATSSKGLNWAAIQPATARASASLEGPQKIVTCGSNSTASRLVAR